MAYPNDADTKLLLHFEDTFPDITDSSVGGGHAVDNSLGIVCSSAAYKFGGHAGYFEVDAYLEIADHADWDFDTNPLTIDFWFRVNSLGDPGDNFFLYSQYDDSTHFVLLQWLRGASPYLRFYAKNGSDILSLTYVWTPTVNTWYHLAVIRGWGGNANDWALCVDGVAQDEATDSFELPNLTGNVQIGAYNSSTILAHTYLDEYRICNGVARWTENFNVPTRAYPDSAIWAGKVNGVINPTKVNAVASSAFNKISGVGSMGA